MTADRRGYSCRVRVFTAGLLIFTSAAAGAALPRELDFGGQLWRVRSSETLSAPGPNYWGSTEQSVWVDGEGLHLQMVLDEGGRWNAVEIFTRSPLGYGTYTFTIDSDIEAYDPNIVAGFFTWDSRSGEANREIDIEFSAWGRDDGVIGQYVVQPYTSPDRIRTFRPSMSGTCSTHRIVWNPQELSFSSFHGNVEPDDPAARGNLMSSWTFAGAVPTEGKARFRINLWLFQGLPPADGGAALTITAFSFIPYTGKR
jgi:hypothetical protein